MRIILVAVSSLDGKITKGQESGANTWNSREDQKFFTEIIAEKAVSIMGSKTYEAAKPLMVSSPGKLRIVLTSDPEKYQEDAVVGQLEFWDESLVSIVQKLEKDGHKSAYLLGGAEVYGEFLAAKLVSELWLTLEPKIFGSGKSIAGNNVIDVELQLLETEKMNDRGTLLLKYEVL